MLRRRVGIGGEMSLVGVERELDEETLVVVEELSLDARRCSSTSTSVI
jgi:hypothetical protein